VVANHQVWWVWLGFGRVTMLLPIFALITLGTPLAPASDADADDAPGEQTAGATEVGLLAAHR
jgi:hypothetical protein